jgi:hypothetical protein
MSDQPRSPEEARRGSELARQLVAAWLLLGAEHAGRQAQEAADEIRANPDLLVAALVCSAWIASVSVMAAAANMGVPADEYFRHLALVLEQDALTW